MLRDDEIEQLAKGSFELDCLQMKLAPSAQQEGPQHEGRGYIRQNQSGKLSFKLYSQTAIPAEDVLKHVFSQGLRPWQLVPQSKQYSLNAVDSRNRCWTAAHIWPLSMLFSGRVVTGFLPELTASFPAKATRAALLLEFFDDVEPPFTHGTKIVRQVAGEKTLVRWTLEVATLSACGYDFTFTRKGPEQLGVEITPQQGGLAPHLSLRVVEALQFVLAKPLQWSVLQAVEPGEESIIRIRPTPRDNARFRVPPPLELNTRQAWKGDSWKMFEKYLAYILPHNRPTWHPLSVQLHGVLEAGQSSLPALALGAGVAVDGVLKVCFREIGTPAEEERRAVHDLLSHINEWAGLQRIKDRARGAISTFNEPRAKDRLLKLRELGLVTGEDIQAWEKLRHSSAHARHPDAQSERELQEYLDLIRRVIGLIYRLIFETIGYEGSYSDYTRREEEQTPDNVLIPHWPVSQFRPRLHKARGQGE